MVRIWRQRPFSLVRSSSEPVGETPLSHRPSGPGGYARLTKPPLRPGGLPAGVLVVGGPPGAGKTTLATHLAQALGWVIADLDTVAGALTGAALELAGSDRSAIDGAEGRRLRAVRYEALLCVAAANLEIGLGVVISAPFSMELADPERWQAVVRRLETTSPCPAVTLVYIDCPPELRLERLRIRGAARDLAKRTSDHICPPRAAEIAALVVNASRPLDEQVDCVLAGLIAAETNYARSLRC
jgi:predicted kinase